MSTIEDCKKHGLIQSIGGNLRRHQQATRLLFAVPRAIDWMRTVLPTLQTDGYFDGAVTPKEQAGVLFNRFVAGDDLDPPLPHEMNPKGHGIWEVRTHDLRLFGWFPARAMFVISDIDTKENCVNHGLYPGYFQQAMNERAQINLLNGAYIDGDLQDVL